MIEKPLKGSGRLARRDRIKARTAKERKAMTDALVRDQRKCRRPKCPYVSYHFQVDPCHRVHRGMGGNPKGDRTTRQSVIALCRGDHDEYDDGRLLIDPLDETVEFDGPCSFRTYDRKTNVTTFIGAEKIPPASLGVSMAEPRKNPDELGALWEKENAKGRYMTGTVGDQKVVVFPNTHKSKETQPDWRILKSKPRGDRDREVDAHPPARWTGRDAVPDRPNDEQDEDPDGLY